MKLSADYLKAKRAAEAAMPVLSRIVKDEAKVRDTKFAPSAEENNARFKKVMDTFPGSKGTPEKTFKTLRSVTIEGTFPELKGRFSTPTGRGQATNVRAAGANAMRDLLKQVKGKKFTHATATVSFGTVQVEE